MKPSSNTEMAFALFSGSPNCKQEYERMNLADALQSRKFKDGECVIQQVNVKKWIGQGMSNDYMKTIIKDRNETENNWFEIN